MPFSSTTASRVPDGTVSFGPGLTGGATGCATAGGAFVCGPADSCANKNAGAAAAAITIIIALAHTPLPQFIATLRSGCIIGCEERPKQMSGVYASGTIPALLCDNTS